MSPDISAIERLSKFVRDSEFTEHGAFVTDLDGTALNEERGKVTIPQSVRSGLQAVHALGRPVIMNTLRFPLSVMRTVGLDWYEISNAPIPTVLLNGSVLGNIRRNAIGILTYEEIAAFPLREDEVARAVDGVQELLDAGIDDLAVFYYPRDWIRGEFIWTPHQGEIRKLQSKFISSTRVVSFKISELFEEIARWDSCMIFILVNEDRDKLMAYQHSNRSSFITRAGVDKAFGTKAIAEILGVSLADSIGAGDTAMDTFLSEIGLAIRVGGDIAYKGRFDTIDVARAAELGELLTSFYGQKQGFFTTH